VAGYGFAYLPLVLRFVPSTEPAHIALKALEELTLGESGTA